MPFLITIWFLAKRIGYMVIDHWHLTLPLLVVLVVVGGFGIQRRCGGKRKISIDLETVNKINAADEKTRRAELQTVIQTNADVVTTVDQRNTIAAEDEAQRNAQTWAKINDADARIAAAKAKGHDVTGPELECMLTGACQ